MDKKAFMNHIGNEELKVASNVYDKLMLAERTQCEIYTSEFCTPNLWSKIQNLSGIPFTSIGTFGGFLESERRIIGFNVYDESNYPIKVLKIVNKSKFISLEHKDYLGAIMSLGIKRTKIGDLVVKDNFCFVAAVNDIADYILLNLHSIGKCPCDIDIINKETELPKVEFQSITVLSTSYRLDCIVSALCNLSRNKSEQYINSGKVLLDYVEVTEKNKEVVKGNTITIRGFGKYKVAEEIGKTNSGRLRIEIKKYI